jgi:hypothetical protein
MIIEQVITIVPEFLLQKMIYLLTILMFYGLKQRRPTHSPLATCGELLFYCGK